MKWTRTTSYPLTTESSIEVENEQGTRGRVAVVWKNQHPQFCGAVTQATGEMGEDEHGEPYAKVVVLDKNPTF